MSLHRAARWWRWWGRARRARPPWPPLLAAAWPGVVHSFDLESPADLARLANPELARRPDLFPLLRVLGSASPALVQTGSESLAGRVAFIDVTGFSRAELARALGNSEPTARRYLDILCGTYVVRQLPPWFENLKKQQVRSPKVYIRDSGILHALLGVSDPAAPSSTCC